MLITMITYECSGFYQEFMNSCFYPSAFDVYHNHDQLLIASNKHGLSMSLVFKM